MKKTRLMTSVLGIASAFSAFLTYYTFRKQKYDAITVLRENGQISETVCGPIEYGVKGAGETVLISHGGGGGYDQGLLFSLPVPGFQFVAPSRPGYLGTQIEIGRNFEAQADAHVALLDALEIRRAAVIGISGGGPPALQFALRYPDRCWGIILLSAICRPIRTFPPFMQQITQKIIPYFDFFPWLLLNTPLLYLLIDRNTRAQIRYDDAKKALFKRLMNSLFPASLRAKGALNDLSQIAKMPTYPLEKFSTPALVIHGNKDSIVPFAHAEWSASIIPNAQFLSIENGDHFSFVTHMERIKPAMVEFLKSHSPSMPSNNLQNSQPFPISSGGV